QGRLLYLLDDVGDGVGLARTGDAEQRLARESGLEAGHELFDRLRLVACRLIGRDELEHGAVVGHPASLSRAGIPYPNRGCPPILAAIGAREAVVQSTGSRPAMRILPGFTVIEALLAMLVVALLLGTAIPAWSAASEAARAAEARSLLQSTLDVAIRHSLVTGSEVVMCPGDGDGCRDSFDGTGGWVAWADIDGDRRRDPAEALLRNQAALAGEVHLRSTPGRRRLVLRPHGGAASGTNVTFTLCDGRGTDKAVALVLANSGRLRSARPAPSAARACMESP